MTPNEYQEEAQRTVPDHCSNLDRMEASYEEPRILHALMGITSEAGELADTIKKYFIYGQTWNRENIKEECGDMLWYIALLLEACNYSLEETMIANIEKLKKRYPEKFTEKDALERKDKIIDEPEEFRDEDEGDK